MALTLRGSGQVSADNYGIDSDGSITATGKSFIKNNNSYATSSQTSYDNASLRLDNLTGGSSIGTSFGVITPNVNYIQSSYNEGTTAPLTLNPYGGNVGIGTSSPSVPLEIIHGSSSVGLHTKGSYNWQAKFESTDAEAAIVIEDSNSTDNGNRIGVIANDMTFITADTERMRINASGYVTTPNQPSFSAWHNTAGTITSAGGIIAWNSTHCNIGSHYNTSNGRFTAPVAGRYFFSWSTLNRRPTAQMASLYKNGSNIWNQGPLLVTPSGNHEATVGASVIISMSASDYVDVRAYTINGGDIFYGEGHANFMGHLIG